jgi:pyruvate/2-oxoglutarate dehydrogenase complex dihydrolipoamide dehydrogenase (E3) component
MGGDCLNVGCVPSKALIRSARAIADVKGAGQFGVLGSSNATTDFSTAMKRLRRLRAGISRHDSAARFKSLGVDVFLGEGRFRDQSSVDVAGKVLRFKKAVVATGARAATPPIEGLDKVGFLTNETVFELTELPERLLVVGGGPIGVELAQSFARLGSHVTLAEMADRFLSREDPEAAEILLKSMRRDGVDVRLSTRVIQASLKGSHKFALLEKSDGKSEETRVDHILVGVGRVPNVEGLNLESADVQYDPRKGIVTNDRLQTTNPSIFAAGDVAMAYKFTHTADAAARMVIQNAFFFGRKKLSSLVIPWCTYTSPEIAHVGHNEASASAAGLEVTTFTVPLAEVDRAILEGEDEGFVKVHVKKGSDKIVGATVVASHAGDMISEITLAMVSGVGLGSISNVIHPYPTQAEAIRKVADAYNRTRLTPLVKRLFQKWFTWQL